MHTPLVPRSCVLTQVQAGYPNGPGPQGVSSDDSPFQPRSSQAFALGLPLDASQSLPAPSIPSRSSGFSLASATTTCPSGPLACTSLSGPNPKPLLKTPLPLLLPLPHLSTLWSQLEVPSHLACTLPSHPCLSSSQRAGSGLWALGTFASAMGCLGEGTVSGVAWGQVEGKSGVQPRGSFSASAKHRPHPGPGSLGMGREGASMRDPMGSNTRISAVTMRG